MEKIVDIKGNELHVGDNVVVANIWGEKYRSDLYIREVTKLQVSKTKQTARIYINETWETFMIALWNDKTKCFECSKCYKMR